MNRPVIYYILFCANDSLQLWTDDYSNMLSLVMSNWIG
jgi:hypothetical protein